MPYTKTTWVDSVTAITAARLNNMEEGIDSANEVVPDNQGIAGQVLVKTREGTSWSEAASIPTVTGEVLEL